jgi:aminocarboxymuconate-semialdehyde decarboxylase
MVIDIHSHVVPEGFPDGARRDARWPRMDHFESGHARVMIAGSNFRTVTEQTWSVARRLEDMDREGVDAQVISPMPELLSYWFSVDDALAMGECLNGFIAAMVAKAPSRFHGLGTIPLQDPDAAAKALDGIESHGLAGIEVGSNILGRSLGEDRFLDFWREVERRGLAVFVHALHPTFADRLTGPGQMVNAAGFPTDTGLTIASLIASGTLQACPHLRMAFSHGGGSFPFILPRIENAWSGAWNEGDALLPGAPPGELRQALPESPSTYARHLYYDTLLFDRRAIRYLFEMMGRDRLLFGSDYPFFPRELPATRTLQQMGLSQRDLDCLSELNASGWLGLEAQDRLRKGYRSPIRAMLGLGPMPDAFDASGR